MNERRDVWGGDNDERELKIWNSTIERTGKEALKGNGNGNGRGEGRAGRVERMRCRKFGVSNDVFWGGGKWGEKKLMAQGA